MSNRKEVSDFTLKVRRSTANRFKRLGNMGDTSDSLLVRLMDFWDEHH